MNPKLIRMIGTHTSKDCKRPVPFLDCPKSGSYFILDSKLILIESKCLISLADKYLLISVELLPEGTY